MKERSTICLEKGLFSRLDKIAGERGYSSRSRAISDFIRRALVKKDWNGGRECAGTISVMYACSDLRPGRGIERLLLENAKSVLSAQTHILREKKLLCVVAVTGRPEKLQRLADALRGLKGVTHGSFSIIAPLS
ncbi:MAG: hypothetical protein NTX59_11595 [Elusimicrobia bacterium]|nr:hypothetical protein [Elusimicrobiota bacterium]